VPVIFAHVFNCTAQIILSPVNNTEVVFLLPKSKISILGSNLTDASDFGIIEVHTLFDNVTLSYDETLISGRHATANHVGIVIGKPGDSLITSPVFVINDYDKTVQVLIILQKYSISGKF